MKFWKNIINTLKPHSGIRENAPVPDKAMLKAPGLSNPSQTSNQDVYAYQVQSWDPETHPQGRGRSYLVQDIEYDGTNLDVTYNDGFKARYDGITPEQARDFATAPSKGRWAHNNLWKKPYKQI